MPTFTVIPFATYQKTHPSSNDEQTTKKAKRCRSDTEKIILEDLFSSVLLQFKKYHPSGNLKLKNLGIFQSLKIRDSTGKSFEFLLRILFHQGSCKDKFRKVVSWFSLRQDASEMLLKQWGHRSFF